MSTMSFSYDAPLPINIVNWKSGWHNSAFTPSFRKTVGHVSELRNTSVKMLFFSKGETAECCSALHSYAREVAQLCIHRGQAVVVSGMKKRQWPMDFEWCFPNELDSEKNQCVVSLKSCLPAVEALIVMVAAFCCGIKSVGISIMNAPERALYHAQQLEKHLTLLEELQGWLPDSKTEPIRPTTGAKIMNTAQWNNLRRNNMPLLLIPRWQKILRTHIEHQCIILKSSATPQANKTDNIINLYTAYNKTKQLLHELYKFLTVENYLQDYQLETAQSKYDSTLKAMYCTKAECLLLQAELAWGTTYPAVALALAMTCKESWWAFDQANKADCVQMMHRCNTLITDCDACVTLCADISEVLSWQTGYSIFCPTTKVPMGLLDIK